MCNCAVNTDCPANRPIRIIVVNRTVHPSCARSIAAALVLVCALAAAAPSPGQTADPDSMTEAE